MNNKDNFVLSSCRHPLEYVQALSGHKGGEVTISNVQELLDKHNKKCGKDCGNCMYWEEER